MKIEITWLGGPTVKLGCNGYTLVLDALRTARGKILTFPGFNSECLVDPSGTAEDIAKADLWLYTHKHEDHIDTAALECIPEDGAIYHEPSMASILRKAGKKELYKIKKGKRIYLNKENVELEIEAVPTRHCTNLFLSPLIKGGNGYLLNWKLKKEDRNEDSYRIYIMGDSLPAGKQRQILAEFKPQLLIVNAGLAYPGKGCLASMTGPLTCGKKDILQLAESYPNTRILPVHWGNFSHYRETYTILDFQRNGNIRLLEPGETWEIQR